jgi:hypothetical protein
MSFFDDFKRIVAQGKPAQTAQQMLIQEDHERVMREPTPRKGPEPASLTIEWIDEEGDDWGD